MFDKNFENRLALWREFRDSLEEAEDPIQTAIDFYNNAPLVSIQADPYSPDTWPDPWQLLQENVYCNFVKILAICYSLQLTERFADATFKIQVTRDRENSETSYILLLDDICIGYEFDRAISCEELPSTMTVEMQQIMPSLR